MADDSVWISWKSKSSFSASSAVKEWVKVKRAIGNQWETVLSGYGLWTRVSALTWARRFADVVHILEFEKMRGANIRFRVLVIDSSDKAIGGTVTRTTIAGGGVAGSDFFWSVNDQEEVPTAIEDIARTFGFYVDPWLSILSEQKTVSLFMKWFGCHSNYGYSYPDFAHVPELDVVKANIDLSSQWMAPDMLVSSIQEKMAASLELLDMQVISPGRCFIRKRGKIYDVFEIRQFNYATQLYCIAYNWVEALSSSPTGEFQEGDTVVLTGGAISDSPTEQPQAVTSFKSFFVGTASARELALTEISEVMLREVTESLSTINTYDEFRKAAFARAPRIAEIFEL